MKRFFSLFPHTIYSAKSAINGEIKVVDQFGSRSLKIGGLEQSGPMVKAIWKKAMKSVCHLRGGPLRQSDSEASRMVSSKVGKYSSDNVHSPAVEKNHVTIQPFNHEILLLGLGGGTLVQMLWKRYPSSRLTAVELDPAVVDISRRFFDLAKYEDSGFLKVVVGDALKFVSYHPRGETKLTSTPGVRPREARIGRNFDPHPGGELQSPHSSLATRRYSLIIVDLYLGDRFPSQAESGQFIKQLRELLPPGGTVIFNRLRTDNLAKFEKNLRSSFQEVSLIKTPANLFSLASEPSE